jgi:hypothetical protein
MLDVGESSLAALSRSLELTTVVVQGGLTLAELKNSSSPRTNPASNYISTIFSKKHVEVSRP